MRFSIGVPLVWVSLLALRVSSQSNLTYDDLVTLHERFWDAFIYPASTEQLMAINSSLYAEDVVGRVSDSGTYLGQELNTEYTFGSLSENSFNPNVTTFLGAPLSYQVVRFATNGNVISSTELLLFNTSMAEEVIPMEINLWMSFDNTGAITQYDISFAWFAWLFDEILEARLNQSNGTEGLIAQLTAEICGTATQHCQGELLQYASYQSCQMYLINQVRLGRSYDFGHNTLLCRNLHAKLLPLRPQVHCPHVGPGGGDMCVDERHYQATVLQPRFLDTDCHLCV